MADTPWYQLGPADESWPLATEPTQSTPIGPAEEEPVGIHLGSRAMETIDSRLEQAADEPFGALLIGHPLAGPSRRFIVVTDVLPFALSSEDEGEVRFFPQLFEQLEPLWRERGEGACVVGWCHAGPKRGIALSSFQQFSHHRYFPRPWQVALIIDTSRHASLLYRWQGSELVPCEAFYYWNMDAEPVALLLESPLLARDEARFQAAAAAESEVDSEPGEGRTGAPWWSWLLFALFIYALIPGAPGGIAWLRSYLSEGTDHLAELRVGLDELQSEQESLRQIVSSAATLPPASSTHPGSDGEASPSPASLASAEQASSTRQQANAAQSEPSQSQPLAQDEGATARDYVIRPGDTMWSISRNLLGDPWAFRRLAETNEIEDPNTIFPGQRLQLPEE